MSKTKIFKKLLDDLKRANQSAKLKMANKFDFKTVKEFEDYLVEQIKRNPIQRKNIKPAKGKPAKEKQTVPIVVHNVDILDASGSMSGGKIKSAIKGINDEIVELRKGKEVVMTQTIIHFSHTDDIQIHCWKKPLGEIKDAFSCRTRSFTALYQTIGETLSKLLREVREGEKVLVKIFTDGIENNSRGKFKNPKIVSSLIKTCENNGFTITFVGTETDVERVIKDLSVDGSNTLVHDNTGEGVANSFSVRMGATTSYLSRAARGEDVTKGFYKKVGTL